MHALQPEIVPEIIARIGMRWWNTRSSQVAGSVLSNDVIKYNLGIFGEVLDELFEAQQKSLGCVLMKLRQSHWHAVRAHDGDLASGIASLFSKTVDPSTNFVRDNVFGVKDGVPIFSDDQPVMKHLMTPPFAKGALMPPLALMPGSLTSSDRPCRREITGTF